MDTPAEPRGSATFRRHKGRRESDAPQQAGVDGEASPAVRDDVRENVLPLLPEICALVKRKTGHDFSRYKQNTLARRIARRISILSLPDAAYIDRLHHDAKEVEDLFQDLLIGVTQFFRDPEAFESIATKVIPQLYKRPASAGPIRIWISGCATGEEA